MKPYRVDGGENKFLYAALVCFGLAAVFAVLIVMGGCSLKSQQIAHVGIQSADVASGVHAVARGGVEINPVMQTNLPTQIALKSVQTAGVIWITTKLHNDGHRRLAKSVLWTLNAVMAGIVVNNLGVAR